ncbi:hypothetical protein PHYSODRAFT_348370 [Phytophthora sojae]|uniref:DUF4246 domain-containing protein n=1 Tax=Phytophthora sojae (strain P6497) TaxID=1094619 RepID=G5AC72_PHYSP|nr:hypothetical protein PHYSODRAFT_348370 [Phytophthora sojae]EGZ06946.1 hypothetical protein PHYSODRAFT_348370 [Phytophthora sojae]|eukprot:XP_009537710.1 hypothetical protein PHYSODRAFT_348370 [Phytophthora sojae]
MSSGESFRCRELQCHQSVNAVNDRSSYVARQLTELDVLSAVGSVVNAAQGCGVARFTQCEATRTTWLSSIERALLERHLSRVLRFSPSLEDTCRHVCSDAPSVVGEGLDDCNALAHYAVFALIDQGLHDDKIEMKPERLARMLYCARQKALPMLVAWLLAEDCASFQQLMLNYGSQLKILEALRLSVRQELAATRVFITKFLGKLAKNYGSDGGVLMATHTPETFIRDGGGTTFGGGEAMQCFKDELEELRVSYVKSQGCASSPRSAIQNILDPSLRCRVYKDGDEQKYQWLPTEFHVGRDGVVSILSPLHGSIHPHQFPGLCAVIPKILGRLLPLFERVLGSIATHDPPSPYQAGLGSSRQLQYRTASNNESLTGFSLRDRKLQVVVKLSTINLDQDNPAFAGEQDHDDNLNRGWQLDGDDHENIVSVGYHVLQSRNITPPRLAFRAFAHSPEESDLTSQEDPFVAFGERTSAFYRGRYGRQFLQPWGSLVLHEGRSIVAPSFLAHRFEPFELLDATNPEGGELTLATFYLPDPTREPIVSTRTVRPEQWQQTRRFVQANVDMLRCSSVHPFLPDEVSTLIADFAASHISEAQAQLTRQLLLMQRRKLQELRFMTPSLRLEEMMLHLDE